MSELQPYRRHSNACPYAFKGAAYSRCNCPLWVYGIVDGVELRRSLKTRDWKQAQAQIETIRFDPLRQPGLHTVATAAALYLEDLQSRAVSLSTRDSYRLTLERLAENCPEPLRRIGLETLTHFRTARTVSVSTQRREITTLRTFFNWCLERGWISSNPARRLRMPKETRLPTLPFAPGEVAALVTACDSLENQNPVSAARARLRARALVLTLVYSGLRVSDVASLRRSSLIDGYLFLRTMKTGAAVRVRLHAAAVASLEALPLEHAEYFFLNGDPLVQTHVFRRTLAKLGRLAEVENCHPHRFRDTFAVELLKSGAAMRTVQMLLGHSSIRITEKYYAPWLADQQFLLDEAVGRLQFGGSTS